MKKPIKISESCIGENKYLKVKEKIYMDEKGNKSSFLITSHNKKETIGTFILPITEDGKVIYLEEFRYGPEKIVINFPVGMLDDGVSEIENCKRELLEETGFFSENFKYLGESIIENYFEGKIKYYVALGCKKISKSNLEIGENLEARLCSISEFEKMIINNKVLSSKTCYCFFLAKYKGYL